jgi:uncharacterized protein YndB with AHSA1/START domain
MVADRIEREVLIEAPVDVVWRVLTEPEQIRKWFTDDAELDLRPGGKGTLTWDQKATGEPATAHLRVESVEPQHRFSFRWDHPAGAEPRAGNSLLVEFTLSPEGESTRLRLVESGFAELERSEEGRAAQVEDHNRGWDVHLATLRDYAPRQAKASAPR